MNRGERRAEYRPEYRERGRDLTPEQRTERRERREERRGYSGTTDRSTIGQANTVPQRGNRDGAGRGRAGNGGNQVGRGNRPVGAERPGRPTMAQQQPQRVQQDRPSAAAVSRPAARPAAASQLPIERSVRPAPRSAEKSNTGNPIE
ncbi:hypothetical protein [Parasphingorhabdus halotolerans]|uniref:Uncharacterized protein n=1 Tax=Parasphingorhabdus halotolerans TaxID=2725558 RepID=A0A6H2DQB1_9SPHN|nr:hypothetical protein [Parasphingorhabdus halotolerans]QJB70388.1 hypothetical protein HF685_14865 [Parasphingorhabdus halotolerans]